MAESAPWFDEVRLFHRTKWEKLKPFWTRLTPEFLRRELISISAEGQKIVVDCSHGGLCLDIVQWMIPNTVKISCQHKNTFSNHKWLLREMMGWKWEQTFCSHQSCCPRLFVLHFTRLKSTCLMYGAIKQIYDLKLELQRKYVRYGLRCRRKETSSTAKYTNWSKYKHKLQTFVYTSDCATKNGWHQSSAAWFSHSNASRNNFEIFGEHGFFCHSVNIKLVKVSIERWLNHSMCWSYWSKSSYCLKYCQ